MFGVHNLKVVDYKDKKAEYPEVTIDASGVFCDCRLREYLETSIMSQFGPHYCLLHNAIVVEGIFEPKDLATIEELTLYIINHETTHWLLCREFDESVSDKLDKTPDIEPYI